MKTINANELSPLQLQNYLQYAIAPRPIALVSTVDSHGNVNLSPFSFFNLFSVNPPLCVFSPSRRVRDNTTKHTLDNLREVPQCVIQVVTPDMLHQTSLSSCEYDKAQNEFVKAGFTALPSELVKPPRVAESPVQLECMVTQIIETGDGPGAGNLVLAEIKKIHVSEAVLSSEGNGIDQTKIQLAARLGGDWYCEIRPENLFKVPKPNVALGIGVDKLPEFIIQSDYLSKNDLARLANIEVIPDADIIEKLKVEYQSLIAGFSNADLDSGVEARFWAEVQKLIRKDEINKTWALLLSCQECLTVSKI
ncbi:flavin reductase family protein [Mucilaginibacter ginkgonis]|uniref:Flavin reductase family protein n=1 Tax=Mucilaginibacter ginkgonis TaxID=2682091 RepID=A0A6I4I619_9SPHI|nr:flavin reductase family protein [Mucilaginibacter ginkgonis]QQL50519.1 flavin reductase family protein [Mucilaginibacter ginkgonis]